jgi:hypothetical protein
MIADSPKGGLFQSFQDVIEQANLAAWATGLRYRVRYDQANRFWHLTETTQVLERS